METLRSKWWQVDGEENRNLKLHQTSREFSFFPLWPLQTSTRTADLEPWSERAPKKLSTSGQRSRKGGSWVRVSGGDLLHFLLFFHSLPPQFPGKPTAALATAGQAPKAPRERTLLSDQRICGPQSMGGITLLFLLSLYSPFAWSEAVAVMGSVG